MKPPANKRVICPTCVTTLALFILLVTPIEAFINQYPGPVEERSAELRQTYQPVPLSLSQTSTVATFKGAGSHHEVKVMNSNYNEALAYTENPPTHQSAANSRPVPQHDLNRVSSLSDFQPFDASPADVPNYGSPPKTKKKPQIANEGNKSTKNKKESVENSARRNKDAWVAASIGAPVDSVNAEKHFHETLSDPTNNRGKKSSTGQKVSMEKKVNERGKQQPATTTVKPAQSKNASGASKKVKPAETSNKLVAASILKIQKTNPVKKSMENQATKTAATTFNLPFSDKVTSSLGAGGVRLVNSSSIRLPENVDPIHYSLAIVPWLEDKNFTFSGEVAIVFACLDEVEAGNSRAVKQGCSDLIVHSKELDILDISVEASTGEDIDILGIDYDPLAEWMIIRLQSPISAGQNGTIRISYNGYMGDGYRGLFYRAYQDKDGVTKFMAATQHQPHWARLVYPCFDEPNRKATFKVVVGRRSDRTAFSNMPLVSSEPAPQLLPDYYLDTFATTPIPMSNYLLVIAVAEYEVVESDRDRRHQILVKPGMTPWTRYALDVVVDCLNFYEEYYGIPYPLPKLAHIAIDDFGGAMENYGLITYDQNVLLIDPQEQNVEEKEEEVYLYVSHEIGHQWTGNLITTDWWDTIWLNEGLTEFFTYFSGKTIDPDTDWEAVLAIAVMNRAIAMDADRDGTNLALYTPVESQEDFVNIFDFTRIYEKGACVTRMLSGMVTHQTFKKAMGLYLNQNSYGNVEEAQLWEAMQQAATEDGTQPGWDTVQGIMNPWARQAGVPVVTITRDYGTNYAYFSQERFMNVTRNEHNLKERWPIYISFVISDGTETSDTARPTTFFLSDTDVQMDLFLGPENDTETTWLLANPLRSGYYVVNYDAVNWIRLFAQLTIDTSAIHHINRGQILSDFLMLCYIELVEQDVCADMVPEYLSKEPHPAVWLAAAQLLPSWRGSSIYTEEAFDTMLARTLLRAVNNVKALIENPQHGITNKMAQQASRKVQSLPNRTQLDRTKRMLTQWYNHLQTNNATKTNTRFVPSILKAIERRSKC